MEIDEYEFEEEVTHSVLAERLEKMAEEIKKGDKLELPMPSRREGVIELTIGEPVEMGIEVRIRKSTIRLTVSLGWERIELGGDEG
ncbi:MAG: amphi-Trp domain-containing protein [Candidatus Thorarchaeota archaeon]|nr:MAG: amphi-Trp domain-containing protein [Candidatus Thorarchaeota archaeon]